MSAVCRYEYGSGGNGGHRVSKAWAFEDGHGGLGTLGKVRVMTNVNLRYRTWRGANWRHDVGLTRTKFEKCVKI